jgi:hypothetical protein
MTGAYGGLFPCDASTQHRCHSAVCNELQKKEDPFRVETRQVIAAQAQHARFDRAFRCTKAWAGYGVCCFRTPREKITTMDVAERIFGLRGFLA